MRSKRLSARMTPETMAALDRISDYHLLSRTAMLETLILEEARAVGALKPVSKRLAKKTAAA